MGEGCTCCLWTTLGWKDSAVTAKTAIVFPLNSHRTTASPGPWVIKISSSLSSLHKQITHLCGDEDRKCLIQLWPRQQVQLSGVGKKHGVYTELHFPMVKSSNRGKFSCIHLCVRFHGRNKFKAMGKKLSTISEQNNCNVSGHSSSVKLGLLRKVLICHKVQF